MGDTDAGQPSGKTKYGRVPLWLYEAGVSLQAVATYGWLHGRYGHFDRITPSYGTLAKEMGVSRGSAIAYVKELQAVGAVRIVQSGAQGRQSNEFAIAFDAPFALDSTGQNADQSAGRPVSGLYSGGQNADPGGQPAVQEEDVSSKTKKTLSPRVPQQAAQELPAAQDVREIDPLIQKLMTDHGATEDEATAVLDQVRREGQIGSLIGWACSTTGALDIKQRLYTLRTTARDSPTSPDLPPWCGACNDGDPAAARNPRFRTLNGLPNGPKCHCHPDYREDTAA